MYSHKRMRCFSTLIVHLAEYTLFFMLSFISNSRPGPEVIKLFSCSAQLRLKSILLINVKIPTIVGILILKSRIKYYFLDFEPSKFSTNFDNFKIYEQCKFHAQLS